MICPECESKAKCVDTRPIDEWRWRRYKCPNGHSFETEESISRPVYATASPVRLLKHSGREMSIADWAESAGLSYGAFYKRLESGWSMSEALQPAGYRRLA